MFTNFHDGLFESNDKAGLGAPEEFVAAKSDDMGAGREAVLDEGFVGESVRG